MKQRKKVVKKTVEQKQNKERGLFDHLKFLTSGNDPIEYWNGLTEIERKNFSPYMINRLLSMNSDWIELVDELQRITVGTLSRRDVFFLYCDILPKGRFYNPYIKSRSPSIPVALATIFREYFKDGESQLKENFNMLMRTKEGKEFISQLMQAYGLQESESKKLKKEIGI